MARKARRIAREAATRSAASDLIKLLTPRELLLAGVVAYWAEGSKSKPWSRKERLTFVNSDPGMITLFLAWLTMLGVSRDRWTLRLHIHETADIERASAFWSEVTGVPTERFRRPTLKQHNPKPSRHNLGDSYVGCLSIDIRKSTELYRQVAGWFEGLVNSLGRRPIGRPQGFGPWYPRSSRGGPASRQGRLFDVDQTSDA